MSIEIINPGLATSVQDLGRPGYFHLGIPIGGAMDRLAMRSANLLVGNDESAAGLESVFVGPEIRFNCDSVVAATGADMPIKIDGEIQPNSTALSIKAGQVLSFDFLKSGARIYIAIAGGIDVPKALGSRSTYPIGALGGFKGRALQKGDVLPLGKSSDSLNPGQALDKNLRRMPKQPAELRVLPGLYWHRITEKSQKQFFEDEWVVGTEVDRMGYRFKGGSQLEFVDREAPFGAGSDPSNIVDSCYPYGSIQVPSGCEPIILHRDAVSGGGYFMIGAVISADMDLIGQLLPNSATRFIRVTMDEALRARKDRENLLNKIRKYLE